MLNIWNWIKGESVSQKDDQIEALRNLVHEQQIIMEDMQREITELIIAEGERDCGGCGEYEPIGFDSSGIVPWEYETLEETDDMSSAAAGSPNTEINQHNSLYSIGGEDFAIQSSQLSFGETFPRVMEDIREPIIDEGWCSGEDSIES